MSELLNCPFCGEDVSVNDNHRPDCYFTLVYAIRDQREGDLSALPEVLAAWNRRAPSNGARDAERYRWLRDNCLSPATILGELFQDDWDSAIDRHIAASKVQP